MAYDYYRRVLWPFCGAGEMRAVNASLARCSGCAETMDHGLYDDLLLIRALPEIGDVQAPARGERTILRTSYPYPPECVGEGFAEVRMQLPVSSRTSGPGFGTAARSDAY